MGQNGASSVSGPRGTGGRRKGQCPQCAACWPSSRPASHLSCPLTRLFARKGKGNTEEGEEKRRRRDRRRNREGKGREGRGSGGEGKRIPEIYQAPHGTAGSYPEAHSTTWFKQSKEYEVQFLLKIQQPKNEKEMLRRVVTFKWSCIFQHIGYAKMFTFISSSVMFHLNRWKNVFKKFN